MDVLSSDINECDEQVSKTCGLCCLEELVMCETVLELWIAQ